MMMMMMIMPAPSAAADKSWECCQAAEHQPTAQIAAIHLLSCTKRAHLPCFLGGPSTWLPYVDCGPHHPRWGCGTESGTPKEHTYTNTLTNKTNTENNKTKHNKQTNIHVLAMRQGNPQKPNLIPMQ